MIKISFMVLQETYNFIFHSHKNVKLKWRGRNKYTRMLEINSMEKKINNFCQTTQDVDSMEAPCLNTKQTHHTWFMWGVQNRDITLLIWVYFLSTINTISFILKKKMLKEWKRALNFCLLVSANRSSVTIWNMKQHFSDKLKKNNLACTLWSCSLH